MPGGRVGRSSDDRRTTTFSPIVARSSSFRRPLDPKAFDFVKVVVIRDGSARLFCEFGQKFVSVGDVVLLSSNVLCGGEPEGRITVTTLCVDADYLIDQVYWQHVGLVTDRLDAQDFAATIYTEPAQVLRLGMERVGVLTPWLDELVALSVEYRPVENFYRMQALWFSLAHVMAPFITTSSIRTSPTQRAKNCPSSPRRRPVAPLRTEARDIAEQMRADPARHWSMTDLAEQFHLSKSQVGRVFVEAYGKSPIAYLAMLRVERMATLLRTTNAPIVAIAREVGWGDPDFAARQFRRSVGVTPSEYRALSRRRAAQAAG